MEYETGIPSLFNRDFLSIASDDFIRFTILKGRSTKQMASWLPKFSGLTDTELFKLTDYLRSRRIVNFSWKDFKSDIGNKGNRGVGEKLFEENCLMCHGVDATGGVAIGFNNPDFFKVASEEFIFNTINKGRRNTAMPSWSFLNMEKMAALLSYIQSFSDVGLTDNNISISSGDLEKGKLSFHYLCSRCHGEFGQGSTGPAIVNKDFLNATSDYFLYKTISSGRSHTAMHGWSKKVQGTDGLNEADISNIIGFLRSEPYLEWEYIYPGPVKGNESNGSVVFQNLCAECHGIDGKGEKAPALNNQEFLNAATNGFLMATITLGRKSTRMPSWGRGSDEYPALSGEEREDLVAFLRSYQMVRIKR